MIALAALALATAPPPGSPAQPPPAAQTSTAQTNAGGTVQVTADFRAAQAKRGPLEGRWCIAGRRGAPLYLIQLADPGHADANASAAAAPAIEGAWCDLARAESLEGCGYLAAAKRTGRRLTLLFFEAGGERSAELAADARGRWRGELARSGRRSPVVMTRVPFLVAVAAGR
jgi:hypothetical protein